MYKIAQVRTVEVVSDPAISRSRIDERKFWNPSVEWNELSGVLSSIFAKYESMKSLGESKKNYEVM